MSGDQAHQEVVDRGGAETPSGSVSSEQRRQLRRLLEDLWSGLSVRTTQNLVTAAVQLPLADGPVLLGGDAEGMPHLLLPVSSNQIPRMLLRTQGVSLAVRLLVVGERPQMFVDIVCRRPGLVRVFLSLATEICTQLAVDGSNPLATTQRVVADWRALFGAGFAAWTLARVVGTFAEVVVLRRLLERHSGAAVTWVGPSGAAQDFRGGGRAIEVKATLDLERRLVTVHGWDQLDVSADTSLHLAWFRLVEDAHGFNLREALAEAVDLSAQDRTLIETIAALKLPESPDPEVDGRRFLVREELLLTVNDRFPRIVPAAFSGGAVPAGVVDLNYTVDLDTVPASNQVTDFDSVLNTLVVST